MDHVPILAGLHNGFFEEEGVDLHVVEPVNHEAGTELVAAGKLDFAITDPIHLPGADETCCSRKTGSKNRLSLFFEGSFVRPLGPLESPIAKIYSQRRAIRE